MAWIEVPSETPAAVSMIRSARPVAFRAGHRGLRHRSLRGWRRHHVHVDYLESQAADPLQESVQGGLIWQVGSQGGDVRADADLAVVEFRAQCGTCRAKERYLVRSWVH